MSYVTKDRQEILRQALDVLQKKTPITSIGPGSVVRSFAEVITKEHADFYSILEFNTAMGAITTARGRALELLGALYNVTRKPLGNAATIEQNSGTFYFYLDAPYHTDITIPAGTVVWADGDDYMGTQFAYVTTSPVLIAAGRTRAYAGLRAEFSDAVFTAGPGTLTRHNADTGGATVRATNPKPVSPVSGYETDDNFRARIIKGARTTAGGTLEAIRFAGLAVPGVRDVVLKDAAYGLGSVEALVVPEDRAMLATAMAGIAVAFRDTRPAGIRLRVREPEYTSLDITATVFLRPDTGVTPDGPARRAEIAATRFINRQLPGQSMVYNRLIQAMMESSDVITDVSIDEFRVSGVEVLRRNYTPESYQQLTPGRITVASN